jgi:hypothetical protein
MLQLKIEGRLIETIGAAEIKMAKSTKVMSNRRLGNLDGRQGQ